MGNPRLPKNRTGIGRFNDDRRAFVRTYPFEMIIYDSVPQLDKKEEAEEFGPNIVVVFLKGARSKMSLNLSGLTEAELIEVKKAFDLAFEMAQPIAARRDSMAQEAYENGDDSYARIYRAVPQLIVRERPSQQHSEGLQVGREDVPDVDGEAATREPGTEE